MSCCGTETLHQIQKNWWWDLHLFYSPFYFTVFPSSCKGWGWSSEQFLRAAIRLLWTGLRAAEHSRGTFFLVFFAVYAIFEKKLPCLVGWDGLEVSVEIFHSLFSVCWEGQNADASGQGMVGLHGFFFPFVILSKVSWACWLYKL